MARNPVSNRGRSVKSSAPAEKPLPSLVSPMGINLPTPSANRPFMEEVRELAYRKWQEAGSPPGDGVRYWLEAEKELGDEM